MKPPKFGNCSLDEESDSTSQVVNTMDDLKTIFSNKWPSAIQNLRDRLDSLVEYDDWDEDLILDCSEDSTNPELSNIILYSASGYSCRRLIKFSKCQRCKDSFLTKVETSDLVRVVQFQE